MSQQPAGGAAAPPEVIYIIRHGEKPADPPLAGPGQSPPAPVAPFGVNDQGIQDRIPCYRGAGSAPVRSPPSSIPPSARCKRDCKPPQPCSHPPTVTPGKTTAQRTYQTIQGLGDRLGLPIASAFAEGQEPQLAASVVSGHSGVVLICWEHHHIPALASSLPVIPGTAIPQTWPGDRFDVIWTFTLVPGAAPVQYTFGQVPQQLLSGDTDTVIAA
jgi:hypothetical protein